MTPQEMKQANERQRRAFESWLRDLEALRAVIPANEPEASGHREEE